MLLGETVYWVSGLFGMMEVVLFGWVFTALRGLGEWCFWFVFFVFGDVCGLPCVFGFVAFALESG